MREIFRLYIVMINRKIREVGINPFFGYLFILVAFIFFFQFSYYKTEFASYIILVSCIGLQFKLLGNSRSDFLLSTFGNTEKNRIRILENLILSVPFNAFLLYKNNYFEAGIIFLVSILFAFFRFQFNSSFSIPTPFYKRPCEFTWGFRKTYLIFFLSCILAFIAIKVDNINLGIFSMLLVFFISLSFYTKPEQEYYVWIHAETPVKFLRKKILIATKNVLVLALPILLSLGVFYPNNLIYILIFLLVGILFLWTMILVKYSSYPQEISLNNSIIMAFAFSFPPLILMVIPFFYKKSVLNISPILNDKN